MSKSLYSKLKAQGLKIEPSQTQGLSLLKENHLNVKVQASKYFEEIGCTSILI